MATEIKLSIDGMTCDHCVHAVTSALSGVPGVAEAQVSLDDKAATVRGDAFDVTALIEAVKEEGYEAAVAA
ncbi:MAG: heavy-metal-associated domain-containing protein [Dehalococcoidia bacterium]